MVFYPGKPVKNATAQQSVMQFTIAIPTDAEFLEGGPAEELGFSRDWLSDTLSFRNFIPRRSTLEDRDLV
jgi:hypothetical protein